MNVTVLADALAPVLRELVDATVAPLLARLTESERRVAELEARPPVDFDGSVAASVAKVMAGMAEDVAALVRAPPTAEEVAALVPPPAPGKDADPDVIKTMVNEAVAALPPVDITALQVACDAVVADVRAVSDAAAAEMKAAIAAQPPVPTAEEVAALIPAPQDGKDVDPETVRAMVAEAVDALPKAVDGKSVTLDDVRPIVDEAVAAGIAAMPTPRDGKDADTEAVTALVMAEVEKAVSALPPAENGKDADLSDIVAEVERQLAARPAPQDGKSVTLDEVLPILQDGLAKAVAALPVAKDGVGLAGLLIDSEGVLVGTLTDGSLHKLGLVRGKDGLDGLSDGDFELVDGATEVTVRLVRGDHVKEWKLAKPTLADMHKGVWREGAHKRGTVVTWGGSQWLAMADTEAKPEASKDWVLVVKRGRDGKDSAEPKPPAKVKLG